MPIQIRLIDSTWPPKDSDYKNELILNYDNWNDYSYRTSFGMYYCDNIGKVHEVGFPKIYFWENDEARTDKYNKHTRETMEDIIGNLDERYCSLGHDLSYYRNLKEMLPEEYMAILYRLNDIAVFPEIRERFVNEKGVQSSLLRFSGAEKALNEAIEIIDEREKISKDISFRYQAFVPYDETPITLYFNFKQTCFLPYRINILIGKNGTGKTQILSHLANSLSGFTERREHGSFINGRPPVDKVMSISYSAFDRFRKPPEDRNDERSIFSYIYCGIQSEQGTLSLSQLKENLKRAFLSVKNQGREAIWKKVLSELMEKEHQDTVQLIVNKQFDEVNLSSGQQILICTMTELIANIENESIILFDEPEIHLHPNAISNVMRMFYSLLEQFNSYAIFSTHSPLILQEIPSRYIQILDRVDNMLTVRQPDVECFGNNISDIIFDVFDVTSAESNYKSYIRKLLETKSYDEIVDMFDGRLSLNALIFMKNCCNKGDQNA